MSGLEAFIPYIVGAVGTVAGVALSKSPSMPKPPKPTLMPDDDATKRARVQQQQAMQARAGRESTVLSSGDKMGG